MKTKKTFTYSKKTYLIMVVLDTYDVYECICDVDDNIEKLVYEFPEETKRDELVSYLEELNKTYREEGKFIWGTTEVDIENSKAFTNYVNPELN